jgi:hypothetical protein
MPSIPNFMKTRSKRGGFALLPKPKFTTLATKSNLPTCGIKHSIVQRVKLKDLNNHGYYGIKHQT